MTAKFTDRSMHYLSYNDVFIIPKFSEIESRKEVDTAVTFNASKRNSDVTFGLQVPIISANMDTVTETDMAVALRTNGAIGALHRFCTIDENVKMFEDVYTKVLPLKLSNFGTCCFVSIGVNENDYIPRAMALYDVGARMFIIDIAHGHSKQMLKTIDFLRHNFGRNVYIMGGNITTYAAANDLLTAGVDAVKVGIGPGFVCTTKDVTGVTMPIFSAVDLCSEANVDIIADGGARFYGDIAKALGAGAKGVMSGYFFAGTNETPHTANKTIELEDGSHKIVKIYRGMASSDAMKKVKKDNLPTPEGISTVVSDKGPVASVLHDIHGGLQSAFSYVNARNFSEFRENVRFGRK